MDVKFYLLVQNFIQSLELHDVTLVSLSDVGINLLWWSAIYNTLLGHKPPLDIYVKLLLMLLSRLHTDWGHRASEGKGLVKNVFTKIYKRKTQVEEKMVIIKNN